MVPALTTQALFRVEEIEKQEVATQLQNSANSACVSEAERIAIDV